MTARRLREAIAALGPWAIDVPVTGAVSTGQCPPRSHDPASPPPILVSPRKTWQRQISAIYPDGLGGRSLLDCGCNCGGYCFFAKELGAGRVYGFDARERWIE